MASTNVHLSDGAYKRLKKLKLPGNTFSDVLLRELPDPCETAGELLDHFTKQGVPGRQPQTS